MIEIQPKGSYFKTDAEGYVINPASIDKIQPEWKPIVDDVVAIYKELYGDRLRNVYLRGSVAKGEAIPGVSDVDTWAYVDLSAEALKEKNTNRAMRKHVEEKYDFVEGIEMGGYPLSKIPEDSVMLNQAVCVYGDPASVPRIKAGKGMATHAPNFHERMATFERFLQKHDTEAEIAMICVWFMKVLLRAGFELTMERSQKYTRDLYRCYETFAEYYPEKEPEMREALHLALNPTADKQKLRQVMDTLGTWLLQEIPKHFEAASA